MSCDLRVLLALLAGFGPAPRALEGTAWSRRLTLYVACWLRGGGEPGCALEASLVIPPGSSLAAWLTWLVTWT
jgi:hypothetical protein